MEKIIHFLKLASAAVGLMVLSSCGGGGGAGGSSSSSAVGGNTLSGTAATGAPIVSGTVTLKDSASLTSTTTTDANGNYSFNVSANFPLMLKVQPNVSGAVPLFSAALAYGTANTTPLTTLQVFEAVGKTDPSAIFNSGDFSKIGKASLDQGKLTVTSNFAAQFTAGGLDPTTNNPITTPLVANGVGVDAILDQTNVAIIGNTASITNSAGSCIPYGPTNVMTLTIDGMDLTWLVSFGAGMTDQYVKKALTDANACTPGIDLPRPVAPNVINPSVMESNVPWTRIFPFTDATFTNQAVSILITKLKDAKARNDLALQNGGTEGPINIVAHSWGSVIAYIALTQLSNSNDLTERAIKIANLFTFGSPIECLAGGCVKSPIVLNHVPSEFSGPIKVPSNVTTWTNYWGNEDLVSGKIVASSGNINNKYVDCAGVLYGDIPAAPFAYSFCGIFSWVLNHSQYFKSPNAGVPPTIRDIARLVSLSQVNANSAQTTATLSPSTTLPSAFSLTADTPYCDTNNPAGPAVKLTWKASDGAAVYRVFRNDSAIGFNLVASQVSFQNNLGLIAGQAYSYKVQALNANGETWSNKAQVTIPADVCAKPSPTCSPPQVSTNGVCVAPPVTCTTPEVLTNGVCVAPPVTCTTPEVLTNGVCVAPPVIPATPVNMSPGSTSTPGPTQSSSTVTVSWNVSSGANSYIGGITDVAAGRDVVTINTSGTSASAPLSPGKQYRWYIYACNSSGCSSSSALYYFQTPAAAPTCSVSFNTSNSSIAASGGQLQVILTTSNSSCTWSATSNQSWVHNLTPSSGTAGATLTYTVDPNSSTQSRSATITAGQATLTISQLGTPASCTFSLGETAKSVPASGGTFVEGLLASNQGCARTAQSNATFITNVSPANGNGDANISYTVASNTSASPRSGTLTIAGQTLTVNQDGAVLSIPAVPANMSPGSTSTPGPTQSSSTVTVSWNVSSGATSYIGGITDVAAGRDVVTINTSGTSASAPLSPGKQYRWYIYACNSSGCSSSSALYYFQTPAPTGYVSQGGLTWMPVTFLRMLDWSSANAYCTGTTINGQTGWRMPTQAELSSLYSSGAMNNEGWWLSGTWSSTPAGSGNHYRVDLAYGDTAPGVDVIGYFVTCVQ